MRSNKMRFFRILPAMLLGGIFVLSGCDNSKDIYNPDRIQEEAKEAFPVKNIDPNQTWEMSAVCNATVSANEKAGEVYTIKVYTANPYTTNGNATLLTSTTVTDGKTANFKFDIPTSLQHVYVMKVNSEGYSSAKNALVTNNKIEVSFGGANKMASAAKTRAVSSIITFEAPDINDMKIYPTKEYAKRLNLSKTNGEIGNAGNYEIDASVKNINNWASGANMFITENSSLNINYIAPNSKLYLLPGVTLTLTNGYYSLGQNGSMISVGTGATLTTNEGIQISTSIIYNAGTIKAKMIDVAGTGYVYSSGTLNVKEKVNISNEKSLLVNEGTIEAASFETQGSSSFYNSGRTTISGKSLLSSNNQKWENQGYFRTNEMVILATSSKILTACQLYIDKKFSITTSDDNANNAFNIDGGAYVQCESLYLNNARILMGGKSFINVLGTATYNYNLGGIYSTTDGFALLKASKVVQNSSKQGNTIGYHGKLYVACDDHFENGLSGDVLYIKWEGDAQLTGSDNANIQIPPSECSPGYNPNPDGGGDDDKVQTYAYAFEDMMKEVGDYDFNDVVLYVTVPYEKNGKRVIDVTLKAAGATKQLAVLINNNGTIQTIFGNVHEAMEVPAGTIVNTGEAVGNTKTETIEVGVDFSLTNNGDFYISDGKREIHIPNFTIDFKPGNVPYALRVASATWKWAKERIQITEAYPDFAGWAQNATAEPTWYNNPVSDKVMD